MKNKTIDYYFVDKTNFHKRNFFNFMQYVENNHSYFINNYFPRLKNSFGMYYFKHIENLEKIDEYVNMYSEFEDINKCDIDKLKLVKYKGIKLYPVVKPELLLYLSSKYYDLVLAEEMTLQNQDVDVLSIFKSNYFGTDESIKNAVRNSLIVASFWIDHFEKEFQNREILNVCLYGGTSIYSRVAGLVAHQYKINAIAFEGFFLKQFHFADNTSGIITNNHRAGDNSFWQKIKDLELEDSQILKLDHLMSSRTNLNVVQPSKISKKEFYDKYNIPSDKKIVLLIGQVINDFSITKDLTSFNSTIDFYQSVINYFEQQDEYHLFVKLHPWENSKQHNVEGVSKKVLNKIFGDLKNTSIDYDINIESLIEFSECAITSCSQSGLEMLYAGKRVLQVGNAYYSNKGWTIDVKNRFDLDQKIRELVMIPHLNDEEQKEVKNYLYHIVEDILMLRELPQTDFEKKVRKVSYIPYTINSPQKLKKKKDVKYSNVKLIRWIQYVYHNPKNSYKLFKRKIYEFHYRDYKIINMVMGGGANSQIFEHMLKRFEKQLLENKMLMVVSNNPIYKADVYHYWRPNKVPLNKMRHPALSTVHHDLERDSESLKLRHFIDSYRNSDMILTLNHSQKSLLEGYVNNKNSIRVVPHGVDEMFTPKSNYNESFDFNNKMVIGISSRRYGRLIKGENTIYDALENLKDLPIKFILIGKDRSIDKGVFDHFGIECEVFENLEYKDYPEKYKEMDVFLIASEAEGGPASLPEAMATGLAIVSTPCGFVPDFVEHMNEGLVFSYGDSTELYDSLKYLVENPEEIKRMGCNAVQSASVKKWDEIISEYIHSYNDLINFNK
ncbi:glycosyltransferase [Exiguobacterium sp. s189]|uniref:glycosyltransferase n=1 Tax=Exiguobacterium sp. s189 TaxID=2751263 RepID=UPI001BE820AC|nr:glycosyltransferase [Exiguobacterium sp. s189]